MRGGSEAEGDHDNNNLNGQTKNSYTHIKDDGNDRGDRLNRRWVAPPSKTNASIVTNSGEEEREEISKKQTDEAHNKNKDATSTLNDDGDGWSTTVISSNAHTRNHQQNSSSSQCTKKPSNLFCSSSSSSSNSSSSGNSTSSKENKRPSPIKANEATNIPCNVINVKTPSTIPVCMTIPLTPHTIQSIQQQDIEKVNGKKKKKYDWNLICRKWGMDVVKEIIYLRRQPGDTIEEKEEEEEKKEERLIITRIHDNDDDNNPENNNNHKKEKSQSMESTQTRNAAQKVKLQEGDVISSIYGLKDPPASLLYGIMRDSFTFEMTVNRMETEQERSKRLKPSSVEKIATTTTTTVKENHANTPNVANKSCQEGNESSSASSVISLCLSSSSSSSPSSSMSSSSSSSSVPSSSSSSSPPSPLSPSQPLHNQSNNASPTQNDNNNIPGKDEIIILDISNDDDSNQQNTFSDDNKNSPTEKDKQVKEEFLLDLVGQGIESSAPKNMVYTTTNVADNNDSSLKKSNRTCKATATKVDKKQQNATLNDRAINSSIRDKHFPSSAASARSFSPAATSTSITNTIFQRRKRSSSLSTSQDNNNGDAELQKSSQTSAGGNEKKINKVTTTATTSSSATLSIGNKRPRSSSSSLTSRSIDAPSQGRNTRTVSSNQGSAATMTATSKNSSFSSSTLKRPLPTDSTTSLRHDAKPSLLSRDTATTTSKSTTSASKLSRPVLSSSGTRTINKRSNKLNRLWPDSSIFSKRVMKWIPPQVVVVEKGNTTSQSQQYIKHKKKYYFKGPVLPSGGCVSTTSIPDSFNNASEMVKFMSAHILEEGRMSINTEFQENSNRDGIWTRPTFIMNLRSCTAVDHTAQTSTPPYQKTYEFGFDVQRTGRDNLERPPVNLGELYAVHSPSWTNSKCCIGMIGPNDINTIFLQDQKVYDDEQSAPFALWMCITSGEQGDTGWLAESDLPSFYPDGSVERETMYAVNIGTATNLTREYEGLKGLAHIKDHLKKAIFCKRNPNPPPAAAAGTDSSSAAAVGGLNGINVDGNTKDSEGIQVTKPGSVPRAIWEKLSSNLNPFQLSAIGNTITGRSKGNFVLLQGPPGTGKTTTIIGLVTALLNGSCTLPGGKVAGTRVQVGNTLSRSSDGSTDNTATLDAPVARRILVCAPSNTAVDDLAWRMHKSAIGPNGVVGGFNIVRFGQSPGEERHDRRGKNRQPKTPLSSFEERDEYLREINLDLIVESIARIRGSGDMSDYDGNKRVSKNINYGHERRQILTKCHVVCTTLSGAGSKAFAESVSRDEFINSEFDAVIIDEACQASEPCSLIPLKYNPNIVVMVGDPQQLPVLLLSQSAKQAQFGRTLFERLQHNGWPVNVLRMQYRMHDEIVRFPSMRFYGGQLITSDTVQERGLATWISHPCFPPYRFWNLNRGVMKKSTEGGVSNQNEYMFIRRLLNEFGILFSGIRPISIGIISFYNDQVESLKRAINSLPWIKSGTISFQISTVDGFQGSEKDIIVLSCVRSTSNNKPLNRDRASTNNIIGFLQDRRRVNVALTRARESLWIVGNCDVLYTNELWAEIINDAHRRRAIATPNDFHSMLKPRRGEHHPRHAMQHQRHGDGRKKRKQFSKNNRSQDGNSKKQKKQTSKGTRNDPRKRNGEPKK